MGPRSVVTGRQRWDVGVVLGRPDLAEVLKAGLEAWPGVEMVCANPATGRLLIFHSGLLSSGDVDRLVREAVVLVVRPAALSAPGPGVVSAAGEVSTRPHGQRGAARSFMRRGGVVVVVAASVGGLLLVPALVRVGVVLAASVVVVRRGWRRASRSRQNLNLPLSPARQPVLDIVGRHRRKFYLASSLSVLAQVLEMTPGLLIGRIFGVLAIGESAALVWLGFAGVSSQVWFLVGMLAVVATVAAVLAYLAGVLWRDLAQSVRHDWRTQTYAHVQRVGLGHLERERTTRLARVLTEDVDQLGRFLATSANDLLQMGTSFAVLVPVYVLLAPGLAWLAVLPVPLIAWLSFSHQEQVASEHTASGRSGALLNSQLANNLQASATVKSFCAEDYEIDRISGLSEAYRQANYRIDTRTSAYTQLVRACGIGSFVGILLAGGLAVASGALPFAVLTSVVTLPLQLLYKMPLLGPAVEQYQRMVASLGRMRELHGLPVELADTGHPLDPADVRGELVFDDVMFAYPGRPPVLDDLTLRIAPGAVTGIVGVTGAGKTTIAKLLLRFHDTTSGRVLIDGHDVREVRL
ncbi:MAG: ABC transporter ATP-binding protein, partial [Pseudonocardiaceae bacterium]